MKRIKVLTLLLVTVLIAGTGCLKDKGFNNHEYGINDPDGSPAGVGFTQGVKFVNSTGLVLSSSPQNIDSSVVLISLLTGKPSSSDIHVQVAADPTIVSDYNTANGTSLVELDPTLYNIATLDVVIPAGKMNASISINVPNTTTLDPNQTYGLGLKIVSADAGYTVASNENKILLSIAIKNVYDGDYTSNGYFYHPSVPRAITAYGKTLSTVNSTSVTCFLGDLGPNGYVAVFDVDPVTFHVTVTPAPGAAGAPYYQWDAGLPTTAPGPAYTPQWPNSAECNNTYDPATHSFKMRYGYIGGTGFRISEEVIALN